MDNKNTVIYWLKRDFRLADNPALCAALDEHDAVMPLFIMEPSFLQAPETSAFHVNAVAEALNDLRSQISNAGGRLALIIGEAIESLERLYDKQPFSTIYSHEEIGINRTYQRDLAVKAWCEKRGILWKEYRQTGVFRGKHDRDHRNKVWKEFNFGNILAKPADKDIARLNIPAAYSAITSPHDHKLTLKDLGHKLPADADVQIISETQANLTQHDFLYNRGIAYRGGISSPLTALTAGSRMSAHLAWGTMTGRHLYDITLSRIAELKTSNDPNAGKWRRSLNAFTSRLHWRDHFIQRLESEPNMEFAPLNAAYNQIKYDNSPEYLAAWTEGRTGFPLVDACIRCLRHTGFINFRMRSMITSLACHTLSLDWRVIDHPLARIFADYEPGIHLSQLQMQAGVVGINTLRIYSPHKQIIDQDPDTIFIKKWIPELREVSTKQIINHREKALGDYPAQLTDWWSSAKVMRNQLWQIRNLPETKKLAHEVYKKHGSRKKPMSKRFPKKKTKPKTNQLKLDL